MLTPSVPRVQPGLPPAQKRGTVSISSYEIGHEEVEVRLYEGTVGGSCAAIVCHNWQVLALASGFDTADVIAHALDKARIKLSEK